MSLKKMIEEDSKFEGLVIKYFQSGKNEGEA